MFGISYGQLFLLLGASAAVVGRKDLSLFARALGRLAGRAVGNVQLARSHFNNIMQRTQAQQVHKELQETLAQLEAIRHEIRSVSFLNPGPLTSTRLVDHMTETSPDDKSVLAGGLDAKTNNSVASHLSHLHTQATSYARLAKSTAALSSESKKDGEFISELADESGLFVVIPVSAESTGMLTERKAELTGSDVVLEAILEADVARNARQFFADHQNQLK